MSAAIPLDRKSTRLNSSHTEIYTLSLHDALPISASSPASARRRQRYRSAHLRNRLVPADFVDERCDTARSEEHTSELQSHRDLHSFPTRRSSDLCFQSCFCSPSAAVSQRSSTKSSGSS